MQTEIPLQIAQDSIEIGITYESDMTVTYRPVSQKAENSRDTLSKPQVQRRSQ